jgi:hypothetical protein
MTEDSASPHRTSAIFQAQIATMLLQKSRSMNPDDRIGRTKMRLSIGRIAG